MFEQGAFKQLFDKRVGENLLELIVCVCSLKTKGAYNKEFFRSHLKGL